MEEAPLSVSVYMKKGMKPGEEMLNRFLEAKVKQFLFGMSVVMRDRDLAGNLTRHDWPVPKNSNEITNTNGTCDFSELDEAEHDADIAVCALPDIDRIDTAFAKLLYRERKLLHVCLLTVTPVPDYRENSEVFKNLLAKPFSPKLQEKIRWFQPYSLDAEDALIIATPSATRLMTIDALPDMNMRKISNIIKMVRMRKAA